MQHTRPTSKLAACPDCGGDTHAGSCEQNFCRECGYECASACTLHPRAGVRTERTLRTLHGRIAEALGWTLHDVRSMSLASIRDLVRPVDAQLATEIGEAIRLGRHILTPNTKSWS